MRGPFASTARKVKRGLHIEEARHSLFTMGHQAGSSAQRIRIGLTGLAAAFIIVLFASAISRSTDREGVNNVQQASTNEPSEPLAELGVAPGASEAVNNSSNAQ